MYWIERGIQPGLKYVGEHLAFRRSIPGNDLSSGPGLGNLVEGEYLLAGRDRLLDHTVYSVSETVALQIVVLGLEPEGRAKWEGGEPGRIVIEIA